MKQYITGNPPLLVTLGALLILLGLGFRWYAIRSLGRYFTRDVAVSANQQVVQSGPYRLIRHPSYTGTLITAIGVGLGICNWLSLVAVLAGFLAGHLYRVGGGGTRALGHNRPTLPRLHEAHQALHPFHILIPLKAYGSELGTASPA
jgi:steroid 5-alpha reductase family enzyme